MHEHLLMLNGLSTLIDPASKSFLRLILVDAQTVSRYSQQNKTTAQSDRLTPIIFVCYPVAINYQRYYHRSTKVIQYRDTHMGLSENSVSHIPMDYHHVPH